MREDFLARFGSDDSVADLYFDSLRRAEHLEPEKALLIAILEDAVREYRKFAGAQDREGKERSREVEEWIFSQDREWIFSFNNVCELLDLDPDYVRRGLCATRARPANATRRERVRDRRAA